MWNMGIDCGKFGFGIRLLPGPEIDSDGDCIVTACLSQVLSDIWAISVIKWKMCSFFVRASDPLPFFVFNYLVILFIRTPVVPLRNYRISAIKKPNQMANRTLNFEAGNGNWWGPRNHERKLLIGPERTLHWIHWRISCSCVGKYGWKTVESRCNLVWFLIAYFGGNLWCPWSQLFCRHSHMCSVVLRSSKMFSYDHRCSWIFSSRCPLYTL